MNLIETVRPLSFIAMNRGCSVKIYMKVDASAMTDALKQISAWDGKTRLKVEDVMKRGTKRIQREAKERAAVRSGTLKNPLNLDSARQGVKVRSIRNFPMPTLWSTGQRLMKSRLKTRRLYGSIRTVSLFLQNGRRFQSSSQGLI